jgi:hypothetical protein
MKRPRLSGICRTFLVIPSKVACRAGALQRRREESLAVFEAILTEIESEMFREACPEQSRRAQHDNAVYVQAGLIPQDK